MDWSEGDVQVNGVRIHCQRRGRGRPIVAAHGFGDNGKCWTRLAQALDAEYEIIAYDARGHGLSGDAGGADSRDGRDLFALVTDLGISKPALLGHSMGASTVAAAAARRPELFSCAILEDPGWRTPEQAATPRRLATDLSAMTVERIEEFGRKSNPKWHDVEFRAWAESKSQVRLRGLPSAPADGWKEIVRAMNGVPVLLITADNSLGSIVTPETADEAKRLCTTLEVLRLEGAGHNIRREAFERFVEAVRAFVAKHL